MLRPRRYRKFVVFLVLTLIATGVPVGAAIAACTLTQISACNGHVCGVGVDGRAYCWGSDAYGQSTPLPGEFTQVAAGGDHSCGVRKDGSLACWGSGGSNPPEGQFKQVAAASHSSCALRLDGTVVCWGYTSAEFTTPTENFTHLSGDGRNTFYGLRDDGSIVGWGNGTYSDPPAGPFTQIDASFEGGCGVREDGDAACWYRNQEWDVPEGEFTQIAIGRGSGMLCLLRVAGTVLCPNAFLLGIEVPAGKFSQIAAGDGFACGIRETGDVDCWGIGAPSSCESVQLCGDGIAEGSESCDEGVPFSLGSHCDAQCALVPCGKPTNSPGQLPAAADALFSLRAAVSLTTCDFRVCDVNNSNSLTASDALTILRKAVGLAVTLDCPLE